MNETTPFQVTPGALRVIASFLGRHPTMQPALAMKPSFAFPGDSGLPETSFEFESFWLAHDTPKMFAGWPKVTLGDKLIPVEPRALERLKGRTLMLKTREVTVAGEKETLEFLVAA